MTDEQTQIETADAAISHVLNRIHESPEVGYYMGACTESFERLVSAHACLHGENPDVVRDRFMPARPRNPREDLLKRVEELERQTTGIHFSGGCHDEADGDIGPNALTPQAFVDQVKDLLGVHHLDPEKCVQAIAALFDAVDVPISIIARAPL